MANELEVGQTRGQWAELPKSRSHNVGQWAELPKCRSVGEINLSYMDQWAELP